MKLCRNILAFTLTALIFIVSSGMTLNLHFCSENLQQVSLVKEQGCCSKTEKSNPKSCEGKSSMDQKSCCKDQKIDAKTSVKAETSITKKQNDQPFSKSLVFLKSYIVAFFDFSSDEDDNEEKPNRSLFPLLTEGLYILLGQFRN